MIAAGKLPSLKPQPLPGALEKQCGTQAPDLSLVVDATGALQFAVASIDDGAPMPLPETFVPAFIDQRACVYRPPVVATRAGLPIKVKNSDPALHNVRAMGAREVIFNVAMPLQDQVLEKKLPPTAGLVDLHCDVHPWMHAWVATFPHDLYAVTDASGHFRIDRVPVGRRPLKLWHPRLGELKLELEVRADAGTTADTRWEVSDTSP